MEHRRQRLAGLTLLRGAPEYEGETAGFHRVSTG